MTRFHTLRPVGLEFLDRAPLRVDVEVRTPLPRAAVWDAFTDARTWPHWFPRVRSADYADPEPPHGVGSVRRADVDGELFEETVLAWDDQTRWTYRIDRCTNALAHAQVESTELSDAADGGTRVRWILASDPTGDLAQAGDALPGLLMRLLEEALANLERYLKSA